MTCAALGKAGFVGFSPIRRQARPLPGHVNDMRAALRRIKELPFVNPDKIALMGFSRGGLLTLMAATTQSDLRAFIVMAPAPGRGHLDTALLDADSITAPILVLVAENDTGSRKTMGTNIVEVSRKVERALKAAKRDVKLIVYPPYRRDGHELFFELGDYWPDVVAFLKQHL